MPQLIKIAFASGTDDLNRQLIARMRGIFPELPLWVVSDFPPEEKDLRWIRWRSGRSLFQNYAAIRAAIGENSIRLAAVMLVPNVPFRRMRLMALMLSPRGFIAFNEHLNHFMLRPRSLPAILRHVLWRGNNLVRAAFSADWRPRPGVTKPGSVKDPKFSAEFAGRAPAGLPRILVASPYIPYPLSHGGAVRMFSLMRRAAREFDQVLVCFVDAIGEAPAELLEICTEIVMVLREGHHELPSRGRPDTVEEFDSEAFRGALRLAFRKWRPEIAQLEFTQMAQYARDCAPARTLLVEHDITFDLYRQMLAVDEEWEIRYQLPLWRRFEKQAWREVDRVVVMSEKDRLIVGEATVLPNGVDLERFRPAGRAAQPRRLLFIGSLAHLPNLLAMEFFLRDVWPLLADVTLHIIAGANHEYFLDFYRERARPDLTLPGVELEGFVSDVRPAYERAALVIAPLIVSAGTNIKVLEAMAMGKAVISTPAGVNGLDLRPGEDFRLVHTGSEMAAAISGLLDDEADRTRMERQARQTVEREYGWDAIAARQAKLYRELIPCVS